jgi:hypothetical protein
MCINRRKSLHTLHTQNEASVRERRKVKSKNSWRGPGHSEKLRVGGWPGYGVSPSGALTYVFVLQPIRKLMISALTSTSTPSRRSIYSTGHGSCSGRARAGAVEIVAISGVCCGRQVSGIDGKKILILPQCSARAEPSRVRKSCA